MGLLNFVEMTTTQAASPFTLAASGSAPTFAKAGVSATQQMPISIFDAATGEGLTGWGSVNAGVLTLSRISSTVDVNGNLSLTPSQTFTFSSAANAKKVWPTAHQGAVAQPWPGAPSYVSSDLHNGVGGSTRAAPSNIRAWAAPHRYPFEGLYSGGALYVEGSPAAGGQIKVYLAESDPNGLPGRLITDFGSEANPIACTATGLLQFTAPADFYVPYAPVWAILRVNGTGSPTFDGNQVQAGIIPQAGDRWQQDMSPGTVTAPFSTAVGDPVTATFPDWSGGGITNSSTFHLMLKRA